MTDQVSSDAQPARQLPVNSAPSVLLTTLGEFVLPDRDQGVWTATLLYVLTGLGIEEQTARQAIARAADSRLIEPEKHGRAVCWNLTDTGAETIENIKRRVQSLSTPRASWNGECLILAITVPQRQKAVRKRLYRALNWAGFGNPAPGLWASPHVDRAAEIKQLVEELELQDSTIAFVGTTVSIGLSNPQIVRRAWDLEDIATRYQELIATFEHLDPEPGDDVLLSHVALVNGWSEFPFIDPQLPEDLLPNWIGRRAVELSTNLYAKWVEPARDRWRELVESTAP